MALSRQPPYNLLKPLPAPLIIFELIKARASRSQQHDVAWLRDGIRFADGVLQNLGVNNFYIFYL